MLGRQVTAALRRPLHARLPTTAAPQTPFALAIRTFTHAPALLDRAGRPRKAVGEPSRPVKRAVKKTAKKPPTPEEEAKVAERKRVAKEKLTAAKQKQRKQDAAEKKKAKEAALTPEELEKRKARVQKGAIRDLRKTALAPPFPTTFSAWSAFVREKGQELKASYDSSTKTDHEVVKSNLTAHTKRVAAAYKELSAGELEHYNHVARVKREESIAEFKRWVESHSIEEIKLANTARRALRARKDVKLPTTGTRNIDDERMPKRNLSAYLLFSAARHESGDLRNISVPERAKLISVEWKALSEDEKEKYNKLAAQDKQRYDSELSTAEA